MEDNISINNEANYDERSAGGLVFKNEDGKVLWLLIKTGSRKRTSKEIWIYKFPKGHIQKREFLKQAALREVEEEGRVKARIVDKIGSNNYIIYDSLNKKRIVKKVTFFLMEYVGESSVRYFDKEGVMGREWMSFEQAKDRLAYDSEKTLLGKARNKLEEILKRKK